MACQAR